MILLRSTGIVGRDDLVAALVDALLLEHATIPPYLTAWLTLAGTGVGPDFARSAIRRIVVDEMRHLQLVANLLIAIGEKPVMRGEAFIPAYPGPLPRGIGGDDAPGGLTITLSRYSKATVRDIFMQIEEPERPIILPVKAFLAEQAQYQTIGQFYAAIADAIRNLGESLFVGNPGGQVTDDEVTPIADVSTALAAIDTIRQQGEGTPATPLDERQQLAHYYLFEALVKGMEIVADQSGSGFAFDPARPIQIDDLADVIPMTEDPRSVPLPAGSAAAQRSDECDRAYSVVLDELHQSFNGQPDRFGNAEVAMFAFSAAAQDLLQQRLDFAPFDGLAPGPRFLWVDPTN